jgi:CHRD domain
MGRTSGIRLVAGLALVGMAALVVAGGAGGAAGAKGDNGKPSRSATPVFKLLLKPSQEVPRIQGLRADAVGSVTFDVTRDSGGAITAGEVVFYFNYKFPSSVTISGLHVHQAKKGANGPIVVDSDVAAFTDADGVGNITAMVTGSPAVLQAILDKPRDYYVNLHTTTPPHPGGAVRDQLHNPKKR